jgi:SAM-dependent methyltransferase
MRRRRLELPDVYRLLPSDGAVLDVGCFGFRQVELAARLGLSGLSHSGVDFVDYDTVPTGFTFRRADLNTEPLPFDSDTFSLVVCNHVLEHVRDPLAFYSECVRVCGPGGLIYIEAPSERSLWLPGFPFQHDRFFSLSFFDDPTHVGRPWSPQSLFRLARYYDCEPVEVGYRMSWSKRLALPVLLPLALLGRRGGHVEQLIWQAVGWASYMLARKDPHARGAPVMNYYIPTHR